MIKDVLVRLDGTAADEIRLAAVNQVAEAFDSHVIGLFFNVLPVLIPEEADTLARCDPANCCRRRARPAMWLKSNCSSD